MGSCLSSSSITTRTSDTSEKPSSAYVISTTGELRQYPVPIDVSQVLQSETTTDSNTITITTTNFFVCNSDRLYFDEFIPSLDSQYQLLPGQIYFVLPASKLQYRLSASDMAALAVKASAALEDLNNKANRKSSRKMMTLKKKNKKGNSRISPVLLQLEEEDYSSSSSSKYSQDINSYYGNNKTLGVSMRSGSVRKLQRFSSRRAKLAVRSFRNRLLTIQEGSVLLFT